MALTLPRVVARTATCVCLRGAGTQMRCNSGTRTLQLALIRPQWARTCVGGDLRRERWTLKKGRDAKMITRLHDVADLRRRVGGTANRHEEWLIDEASRDSFPASDPASSTQPGSIVNERYADAARERETVCGNSPLDRCLPNCRHQDSAAAECCRLDSTSTGRSFARCFTSTTRAWCGSQYCPD